MHFSGKEKRAQRLDFLLCFFVSHTRKGCDGQKLPHLPQTAYFDSRTRAACDITPVVFVRSSRGFDSHTRAGCDSGGSSTQIAFATRFRFAHPREVRRAAISALISSSVISIRAPAQGATWRGYLRQRRFPISIRAPA